MSEELSVKLDPPYPVRIRDHFEEVWSELIAEHGERPWMIVADSRLLARHRSALRGLGRAQRRRVVEMRGGEAVKSLRSLERLARAAMELGLDRSALVVALGGGTIGDLAGFFAATWMRGIDWCPVATTSLAMADSAVGGKTAVNLGGAKNLVGSFHQPIAVYGALEALDTLSPRHRRSGLAEVLKIGVIRDSNLFDQLLESAPALAELDRDAWRRAVVAASAVKAQIVAADPKEGGERAVLNFGHTVGHALEVSHRPRLLHGEAVALGMISAAWASEDLDVAPRGTSARVVEAIQTLGLPHRVRDVDRKSFWRAMSYDKKAHRGVARLVLTQGIGSATVGHRVERKILQAALRALN